MKKTIGTIIIILILAICLIETISTNPEEAMNKCIESGQSESWCEYHVYE